MACLTSVWGGGGAGVGHTTEGHLTELVLNERWVKVEHLKALLRSKKLPCSGHKKALIKSLLQYQRRVALASRPTSTATSTSVVAEGPATSD
jgi:hypothetical protein